jgi:7-keto-8-aminopelargonate synthetase-like enzyme
MAISFMPSRGYRTNGATASLLILSASPSPIPARSDDYLAMGQHPKVIGAMVEPAIRMGTGAGVHVAQILVRCPLQRAGEHWLSQDFSCIAYSNVGRLLRRGSHEAI